MLPSIALLALPSGGVVSHRFKNAWQLSETDVIILSSRCVRFVRNLWLKLPNIVKIMSDVTRVSVAHKLTRTSYVIFDCC